jgi:hypothetical protein
LVSQVIFSPDSRLIALNSHWLAQGLHRDSVVPCYRLVEAASGKDVVNKTSADYPWTVFLPSGRVLAGSYQIEDVMAPVGGMIRVDRPTIGVVDAVTGKKAGELPSYPKESGFWAVSPNAAFLASVSDNRTILVWDLTQTGLK